MDEFNNSNLNKKNNKGLVVLIIFLVVVILGLSGYMVYDKFIKKDDISKENNTIINDNTNNTSDNLVDMEYKTYDISLEKLVTNKTDYETNIGDFKITLKYLDDNSYKYAIYVNDKYIVDDYAIYADNVLSTATFGDYLIFVNSGKTSIRSDIVYVISKDGILVNKFYELDSIKGMVVSGNYSVSGNNLIINGTRVTNGPAIVYNDNQYDNCESLSQLDSNLPIDVKYTYEIKNGKFELSNKETTKTLKEFMQYELKCTN